MKNTPNKGDKACRPLKENKDECRKVKLKDKQNIKERERIK
jgi:hypothetical protein